MGRVCEQPNCLKQASYGIKGSRRRQFCSRHAADGMVDVCSKICRQEGCSKYPSFGIEGSRKRQFCARHSADGMVDVS
ncbi:unnamed protein product, partial [Ectocarpus fasciculatus]